MTTKKYYLEGRTVDGVEDFQYADENHIRFGPVFPSIDEAETTRRAKGFHYLKNYKTPQHTQA